MRRVGLALTAAMAFALVPASAAFADPSPGDSASPSGPTPGAAVCTISGSGVTGLTGLAVTSDGYAVVTGARSGVSGNSYLHVYLLGSDCKTTKTISFSGKGGRDPQDLVAGQDGALWVGDIGDNGNPPRPNIGVWKVPTDGSAATLYRMAYPDGGHFDAEALLVGADGVPLVITKGISGPAQIFQPTAALDSKSTSGVPLKQVGTFTPQKTGTPSKFGNDGAATVTGANVSADGTKVVIRTLTDAYEWDVADGNLLTAITSDKYRITPLPNEPAGSAIAYTADGKFVTLSNTTDSATPRTILSYTPTSPTAAEPSAPSGGAGAAPKSGGGGTSWFDKLTFTDLTYIVGVIGVIGLLMIVGGVVGIRRSRKLQRAAAKRARDADRDDDWDSGDGYENDPRAGGGYDDRYADRYGDDYAGERADRRGYYDEEPDDRDTARGAGRRAEAGTHPTGGAYPSGGTYSSGGRYGDDFDAGYPDSYGSGYSASQQGGGFDYADADQRGTEYGGTRRSRDVARDPGRDSWTDEPTNGRTRPPVPPPPEAPARGARPDPRRTTGRAAPPPPRNTWADEHEGFGDLR